MKLFILCQSLSNQESAGFENKILLMLVEVRVKKRGEANQDPGNLLVNTTMLGLCTNWRSAVTFLCLLLKAMWFLNTSPSRNSELGGLSVSSLASFPME